MPSVVTLVIYLSAADAADPASAALRRSAQEILGNQAQVIIRATDTDITDQALQEAAPQADAAGAVSWLTDDHRRANVRCYVTNQHRLLRRDVGFDQDANLNERERMLGFVVASMLPLRAEAEPEARVVERRQVALLPARNGVADKPSDEITSARQDADFYGLAEVVGLGATGIGGTASGFGAALGVRWLFSQTLALRLAGGLRRGDIPQASATSEVDFVSLGLALEYPLQRNSSFSLGGRSSALVLRHEVAHLSSDDIVPDRQSRVLPGADAFLEGTWHFSNAAGFVVGVGAELAFGHTDISVKANKVAEIPPVCGVMELGIQAKF